MARHEELSVEAAAERLGITADAVRGHIDRGVLRAIRRNGREQVVLKEPPTQALGSGDPPTTESTGAATNSAVVRLRAEIWRQKRRVIAVERERDRLVGQLERQQKLMDLECALRARLQDQIDCLCDRLATALPEVVGDPTEGADLLWKRLERHVERLSEKPPERSG